MLSRGRLITAWFVIVAVAVAVSILAGAAPTPGTWAMLVLMSLAPVVISFVIWRAPSPTVAEVLYGVDGQGSRR